jgi:uncharacterized membrane protein
MEGNKENKNVSILYTTVIAVAVLFVLWYILRTYNNDSGFDIDNILDIIINNKKNASDK